MPKVTLIDVTGKEVKQLNLNESLFGADVNEDLVAQAIRTRMYNAWLGTKKTKARGEVRGGGRKPWRQKGTGRARHGSIRSPIWVGGGHAHALRPTDKRLKMPKKMRRQALFSALTDKLNQKAIKVVQKWEMKKPKTKDALAALEKIDAQGKVLIVLPEKSTELAQALNNIGTVRLTEARLLHPYDILHCDTLVILEESLSKMEETFLNSK